MGRGGWRFTGGGWFSSSAHSDSSETIVRNAAASKGLGTCGLGLLSFWFADSPKVRDCKNLVRAFEQCGIIYRKRGGKDADFCQAQLKELEKDCAEYKSSWSDWWSNELKKEYCERKTRDFNRCMTYDTPFYEEVSKIYRDELEEICGIVVD
ncbi:hypothetical protein PTKIN_Ptkin03bG0196700 [Pterospermum kingtungense]